MKASWLLDGNVFDSYRDELAAEIRRQGHEVQIVLRPKPGYSWDDAGCTYRQAFPVGACVVVHGDIDLALRVRADRSWRPGAYCSIDDLACSRYYSELGAYLLNSDHILLPFHALVHRRDFLFETFGQDDAIFIRPDSTLKPFPGQVALRSTFDIDVQDMALFEFPADSLVVVSSPKTILAEWRFVVVDHRVIAGSQYMIESRLTIQPGYDHAAWEMAQAIAGGEFQPDSVWTIDICRTDTGNYRLLEIGGFSFANLYACDKAAVVDAVSQAAVRDWNRTGNG